MWDYSFFSYHRIYGTAWSASVLAKALREKPLEQPAQPSPRKDERTPERVK
jgi:hypothetical protein